MVVHVPLSSFPGLFDSKAPLLYSESLCFGILKQENETILQILGQLLAILKHVPALCLNKTL